MTQATRGVRTAARYEYRQVTLPREASRDVARAVLTEFAEYGRWELDRHRIYPDGRRTVRLRRRIIRLQEQSA
jgi:hypothetical protein